jgi:arabinose-5-phosphate isomerase
MGNTDGPLIKKVDVFLNSSVLEEADPLGIVPTASFMVTAALGDALASGLMKRKKFTKSEYAQTHPAGQLGRNLLFNVDDVMHPLSKIALVRSDTLISELVIEMTKHPLGAACVVQESKLLGIVTDGDLRRSLMENENLLNMTAKQIMNEKPKTINPALSLGEALSIMEGGTRQVSVLPVANPGQDNLIGLLRLHDIYSTDHK